jgi:hypothetical protein
MPFSSHDYLHSFENALFPSFAFGEKETRSKPFSSLKSFYTQKIGIPFVAPTTMLSFYLCPIPILANPKECKVYTNPQQHVFFLGCLMFQLLSISLA